MTEWDVEETWWDHSRETLKFRLIDEDGQKALCGVTQIAINDYFRTEDTIEAAEANFENNTDFIVSTAARMIEYDDQNEDGIYLITSDVL